MQGGKAAVEWVFREEYGRLIASLVRRFGDIDIAEEAAGEALVAALEERPQAGVGTARRIPDQHRCPFGKLRRVLFVIACHRSSSPAPGREPQGSQCLPATLDPPRPPQGEIAGEKLPLRLNSA